tara:strand:+ start:516 stop:944 length:429 start_codon:yes stop_codon:yes gene_type:complete
MKQDLNKIETIFKGIIDDIKEGSVTIEDATLELGTTGTVFTIITTNAAEDRKENKSYYLRLQKVLDRLKQLEDKPKHNTFTKIDLLTNDVEDNIEDTIEQPVKKINKQPSKKNKPMTDPSMVDYSLDDIYYDTTPRKRKPFI